MKKHALTAAMAAAAAILSCASGCGNSPAPSSSVQSAGVSNTSKSQPGPGVEAPAEPQFPIVEKPITLTWFYELDGKTSVTKKSYGEVAAYQKVEELTNIHIEWQHPPVGQTTEQFNLMMASGDLADIVNYNWRSGYPGGAAKAISENLILPLNGFIDTCSPNLKRIFTEYPAFAKDAKTDEGDYFMYPYGNYEIYQRAEELKPAFFTFGWQIRQDWLDKAGMEVPETLDDWYRVLTAFKTQDPNGNGQADEIPLIHKGNDINQWLRAWGLHYDFCVVDEKVKYGAYEPEYRDYLETMNKWYTEGLLDVDYVTTDGKQFDAKVSGSLAGAWTGATSGTLGRFVQLMKDKEPSAKLTGTVQPYVAGGKPYNFDDAAFFPVSASGSAVSAKCKYPEEAAKLLDIGYSEMGDALYNWGIEGKSYRNNSGSFTLTEEITSNPDGLSLDQALAQYAPGANGGVFFASNSLWNQRMWMPEQQEAVSRWSVGSGERIMPPVSPTAEESARMAEIISKVNTYRDEMLHKFIMGIVPLSEFDSYIKNIRDMGIEEAISIQQTAYDRYQSR